MWLAKYILFYLLTLFNSLDGYYLDDKHSQNTGRHRRKGKTKIKYCGHNFAAADPIQKKHIFFPKAFQFWQRPKRKALAIGIKIFFYAFSSRNWMLFVFWRSWSINNLKNLKKIVIHFIYIFVEYQNDSCISFKGTVHNVFGWFHGTVFFIFGEYQKIFIPKFQNHHGGVTLKRISFELPLHEHCIQCVPVLFFGGKFR